MSAAVARRPWPRVAATRRRHGALRLVPAMALLAVAGCTCDDPPEREPESGLDPGCPTAETEFFVVYYCDGAAAPTPEELAALDTHFRVIGMEAMSVPAPAEKFEVHLYPDKLYFVETGLCDGFYGCATGNEIHVARPVHRHELVHIYLWSRCGRPIALFEEGLAVALGDRTGRTPYYVEDRYGSLSDIVLSNDFYDNRTPGYPLGGAFVSWLASEYDLETVLQAACSLERSSDRARIEEVLLEHFGSGLLDLEERARATWPALTTEPCPWDALRERTLALGATEVLPVPPGWILPEPVFLPPGARYARVRLEVFTDAETPAVAGGGLYQCGDPWSPSARAGWTPILVGPLETWGPVDPSGRYLLDTYVYNFGRNKAGDVQIEVVDWEPLSDGCEPAVVTPLPSDFGAPGQLTFAVWTALHGVDYAPLDPAGAAVADSAGQFIAEDRVELWHLLDQADAGIWVCPGGCQEAEASGFATCSPVPTEESPGLCLDPGLYTLIVLWYGDPVLPLTVGDPHYVLSGRRDISLRVGVGDCGS